MILVVGATGLLGLEICNRLRRKNIPVRGLVREGSHKQSELEAMGVEIVHGDLKDLASVDTACRGADCIVSTANSIMSRRRGDNLESVDRDGQLGLIATAHQAGVRHFVFVSVSPNSPDCAFVRYKRRVEKTLRESDMTWTILQPSGFMEILFSPIAGWDVKNGKVRVVGDGDVRTSFISLYDVAEFAVLATENVKMQGRAIPLGGPLPITAMEAVKVFEEVTGKAWKIARAPRGVLKFAALVARPFNGPLSTVFTLASHDQPDVIDMAPLLAEFPVELTSVREVVRRIVSGPNR